MHSRLSFKSVHELNIMPDQNYLSKFLNCL